VTTKELDDRRKQRRRIRTVGYLGVIAAWAFSVGMGVLLEPPEWVRIPALFVHLMSLVVGLGAVVMVEWHGLLWATGWSTVREVVQADKTLILPIWAGLAGLLASGALLEPSLDSPLTVIKLGCVLVLSLNGVALTRWTWELGRLPAKASFHSLPFRLRAWFIGSGIASQLAWWTAVFIGMWNSTA